MHLRAPRVGRPARAGIAIGLGYDFHRETSSYLTGGIVGALPPRQPLEESWGGWHRVRVEPDGDQLKAVIDDILVQDLDMSAYPELKHRPKRGYTGFPGMGYAYRVRNLRLEKLPGRVKFVELFDGRTPDGSNGHGKLHAKPVFGDFEFTAAARSHGHVNSGFLLRGSPAGYRGCGRIYPTPTDRPEPRGGRIRRALVPDADHRARLELPGAHRRRDGVGNRPAARGGARLGQNRFADPQGKRGGRVSRPARAPALAPLPLFRSLFPK